MHIKQEGRIINSSLRRSLRNFRNVPPEKRFNYEKTGLICKQIPKRIFTTKKRSTGNGKNHKARIIICAVKLKLKLSLSYISKEPNMFMKENVCKTSSLVFLEKQVTH